MAAGDVKYALRALARSPLFTMAAVASLALGIGANVAIFSFVNAIFLRPLPVAEPGRLVSIYQRTAGRLQSASYPDFLFYRDHNRSFSSAAAYVRFPTMVRTGESAERVFGEYVSPGYFSTLGLGAALGRLFLADEGVKPGADPVVVLSHEFWQTRLGGEPGVIGRKIAVGNGLFTIVGVAARGFRGIVMDWTEPPALWAPLSMYREAVPILADYDVLGSWGMYSFLTVARLQPGATLEQARADVAALEKQLARERPQNNTVKITGLELLPIGEARFWPSYRPQIMSFLALLMTVVGLVLLMACLNVANLMLARGANRQREIAIRIALGAGRARVVRALVVESGIVALAGGIAGVFVAMWIAAYLGTFSRAFRIPLALDLKLDARVLLFAIAASALAALLSAVLPARQAWQTSVHSALKAASGAAPARLRAQNVLVVAQIALSVALLSGAGLFLRTLRNAFAADVTADPGRVLVTELDVASRGYRDDRAGVFYSSLLERVRALPGVSNAALVYVVPLGGTRGGTDVVFDDGRRVQVGFNVVTPGYFDTIGIPLLRGRAFADADRAGSAPVAIINDEMAQRFWPGEDPVGRRFRATWKPESEVEVAGVVRDGKFRNYRVPKEPTVYVPLAQRPLKMMSLEVRTADLAGTSSAIRRAVAALDRDMPVGKIATLKAHFETALSQERLTAALLGGFAAVALLLAAVGIYGVLAFAVSQRTREIGIRMALGAQHGNVLASVLRRAAALAGIGLAIGLAASLALARLVAGLLFGVAAWDPLTFGSAVLVLAAIGLLASFVPARRAANLDPVTALRHE